MNAPRRNPDQTAALVACFLAATRAQDSFGALSNLTEAVFNAHALASEVTNAAHDLLVQHAVEQGLIEAGGATTSEVAGDYVALIQEDGHGVHLTAAGHVADRF